VVARTKSAAGDLRAMELEASNFRTELDRLIAALARSDEKPDAIVQAIAERQSRLRDLEARLRAAKAAPEALSAEASRIEREALRRIANWTRPSTRTSTKREPS
jgi:chromosome segregation ATPase